MIQILITGCTENKFATLSFELNNLKKLLQKLTQVPCQVIEWKWP